MLLFQFFSLQIVQQSSISFIQRSNDIPGEKNKEGNNENVKLKDLERS